MYVLHEYVRNEEMGKLVKVEKEKLKISAKEHERKLKEDKVSAKSLEERDQEVEETLKKLKEGQ